MTPRGHAAKRADVATKKRAAFLRAILARSAFSRPSTWPSAVICFSNGRRHVTSRADFASWLANNALPELAGECQRKVRRGAVLVYIDHESAEINGVGFIEIPVCLGD